MIFLTLIPALVVPIVHFLNINSKKTKTPPSKKGAKGKTKFERSKSPKLSMNSIRKKQEVRGYNWVDVYLVHLGWVFVANKQYRNMDIVELFGDAIIKSVTSILDHLNFREKTGVDIIGQLRGEDGKFKPQKPGSKHPFHVYISISETENYTIEDVKKSLRAFVQTWNDIGGDPKFFNYTSEVQEGEIFGDIDELKTFDTVLSDKTVIEIMKALYDVSTNDALLEIAEDEDIVTEFFQDHEQGKEAIKAYIAEGKRN